MKYIFTIIFCFLFATTTYSQTIIHYSFRTITDSCNFREVIDSSIVEAGCDDVTCISDTSISISIHMGKGTYYKYSNPSQDSIGIRKTMELQKKIQKRKQKENRKKVIVGILSAIGALMLGLLIYDKIKEKINE